MWWLMFIPVTPPANPTPVPRLVLMADDVEDEDEDEGGWVVDDLLGRLKRLVTVDHPPMNPP